MKTAPAALMAACITASMGLAHADETPVPVIGPGSYGQFLANETKASHANLADITIFATLNGQGTIAVGSTTGITGEKPSGLAADALAGAHLVDHYDAPSHVLEVALPLSDMQQHPAGVVALTLTAEAGENQSALRHEAEAIAHALARGISYAANLVQEANLDPNVPMRSYAQYLVDRGLSRHRDVIILAIHATTLKNSDPEILASNIGRIGKKADDDDMRVVRDGQTNLEVNKALNRFEVELPLNNAAGTRIGALGVVFVLTPGLDQNAKHQEAIRIRNQFSARIPSPTSLVGPYPSPASAN